MKTAELKTKWELFKFRTAIIFYCWLTLTFLSIFAILKLSQWQDYPHDTFSSVVRVQGCIFVDGLGLTHGLSVVKGCEGYKRFVKIQEIGKPQARVIKAPFFSLILVFAIFGLVLQNQKRKSHESI